MTEEQKQQLEQQLWNIANTLRGKMDADEFRDTSLASFSTSIFPKGCARMQIASSHKTI